MQIFQVSFYEQMAKHIEQRLSGLDETGYVNCLIAFKEVPFGRQHPLIIDLE